jgi:alpha-mannosidase
MKILWGEEKEFFSVINTAGWVRSGLAQLPFTEKATLVLGAGGPLITQSSDFGGTSATYVYIPSIDSFEIQSLRLEKGTAENTAEIPFKVKQNGIDTPFYRIKWNKQGQLVSIFDKETNRETLTGPGNQLQIFEDRPRSSDAWEHRSKCG